jgi:DNA recombination protein RmuC
MLEQAGLWLASLLGLVVGAAVAWGIARSRGRAEVADAQALAAAARTQDQVELAGARERAHRVPALEQDLAAATQALAGLREQAGKLGAELAAERDTLGGLRTELEAVRQRHDAKSDEANALARELAQVRQRLATEVIATAEKLALLTEAKQALGDQFQNLANAILEDKARRFTEQNQANLGALLDPLKQRIAEFQAKIEDTYVKEGRERTALGEQVRQLMALNNQLSEDAKNLTRALRGSSKTQGNWGELILERVLEASGLRKGEEYVVQSSHTREDGTRALPDVVIHLPDRRSLVVDAKVSLVAYEEFAIAELDSERAAAGKRHIDSVRSHIRGLSAKNYQSLYALQSLDFVLLFVPIEPAFMLAVATDQELFMEAWSRNVLLVSPSTLLFVVRTVAHLWRQEAQSRNAVEIAKRGAELYDKFVAFLEDMTSLGNRLRQAQLEYEAAYGKLATGRGHLIGQAEKLRALGVKPTKTLPQALQEGAAADARLPLPLVAETAPDEPS